MSPDNSIYNVIRWLNLSWRGYVDETFYLKSLSSLH